MRRLLALLPLLPALVACGGGGHEQDAAAPQPTDNIIVYETGVKPTFDELRKARKKTKQEALESIAKFKPRGGTNIHDALELAFQDPEVDTVYLLTDGQPSAGRITDIDELADAVRRWNYSRQIVIHGIAVGQKSALLKRLAEESGGEYVLAR